MASIPQILDVYPAPDAQGIVIGDQIRVVFDQEMDEDSINVGTFLLTAPDTSVLLGPGVSPLDELGLEDEDLLSSPYYGGFVKGSLSFSRQDASGGLVDDDEVDYAGAGTSWRTVAIFIPDAPLAPNMQYTVVIAGDEDTSDAFDTGVNTRTVFDPEATAVTGTGLIDCTGGYTGETDKTYTIEITAGGSTGNATYQWWDNNDPLVVYPGVSTTGIRELEDGLCVSFSHDGSFTTGDTWQVVCIAGIQLDDNYRWSFTTGSGSVITPPSSSSASGISELGASTASSAAVLEVSSISPAEGKYGVTISTDPYTGEEIVVTFDSAIDTTTLVGNISLRAEAANGDDLTIYSVGELDFDYSLSSTILTITLDPGQLYENNIIVLELDSLVADTDGVTLGTDYISYFSTPYTPLYSSLRRIRMDLGGLIEDVEEEPIMLAILDASLHADAMEFIAPTSVTSFYKAARREYVSCLAELKLLRGLSSNTSDRMSKTLGDLTVSRGGNPEIKDREGKLEDCVSYWKVAVETGGATSPDTSLEPEWTVKGAAARDRITVTRQWEPTSGLGSYRPSANTRVSDTEGSSRKGFRTHRKRY